jgi:hypothetical protein
MINKNQLLKGINTFVSEYSDKIALDNPLMCFVKPVLTRVVNNKLMEYESMLSLIADKDGNIDIEGILTEIGVSLTKVNPFNYNIQGFNISVGGGTIGLDLPIINKHIVFNADDIEYLKELLIENSYGRNIIGGIPKG